MRERSFYIVWCVGGGTPTVSHDNYRKACAEAERLARNHRGQKFAVLESRSMYQVQDVLTTHFETDDRDIPF